MDNIFNNENTTFTYEGCEYAFDLDEIFKYVCQSRDRDIIEKEITDQYEMPEGEAKPRQTVKLVKEVTTPMGAEIDNIRYDLVKTLIIVILNAEETVSGIPAAYGVCFAFNTLYAKNLIKKLTNE